MSTSRPKTVRQKDRPLKIGKPEVEAFINVRGDGLMDRVVFILEQARANVVRAVNSNMVIAYWLIGREIVQDLQSGEERAEYGRRVLEELSGQLTLRYGRGFSVTYLKYFRLFYQAYSDRLPEIRHTDCDELTIPDTSAVLADLSAALDAKIKLAAPAAIF